MERCFWDFTAPFQKQDALRGTLGQNAVQKRENRAHLPEAQRKRHIAFGGTRGLQEVAVSSFGAAERLFLSRVCEMLLACSEPFFCCVFFVMEFLFPLAQGRAVRRVELPVSERLPSCRELFVLCLPGLEAAGFHPFGERLIEAVQDVIFRAERQSTLVMAALFVLDAQRTDVRRQRETVERVIDGII